MLWYNNITNIWLDNKLTAHKKLTKWKNAIELQNWFNHLCNIALERYEFEGLPDTVNERVLVEALLWYSGVVFFKENGCIIALPGHPSTNFNIYGDASDAWVYGRNGYNKKIKLTIPNGENSVTRKGLSSTTIQEHGNGVYVRENKLRYPFINYVVTYAEKISDTMRTIDMQRKKFKRSYVVTAQEEVVNTVRKFFKEQDDNEDFIIGTGVFPVDRVDVIPLTVTSDEVKAMTDLQEWYFEQFKEFCGLNSNPNTDKKERLLVDEVNANNENTEYNIDRTIDYINDQLELVNSEFGTNIKCKKAKENKDDLSVSYNERSVDKDRSVSGNGSKQ